MLTLEQVAGWVQRHYWRKIDDIYGNLIDAYSFQGRDTLSRNITIADGRFMVATDIEIADGYTLEMVGELHLL